MFEIWSSVSSIENIKYEISNGLSERDRMGALFLHIDNKSFSDLHGVESIGVESTSFHFSLQSLRRLCYILIREDPLSQEIEGMVRKSA